ncbi:fibrobacter succinogenes major paralogous domain-containing protein [Fibrobacter sp.]|uniref:fibrobacter succinogenes major paralogous domain-containing protein n=1 Tax=Fibrobacter sp. TaxID=35828 RepID=UPI00386A643B
MFLKKFLTIGFVAAVFFACGDNGSSAADSDEESSSSVCEDCDGSSSSKAKSSSSIKKSSSSSAMAKSSSSFAKSSSSSKAKSSSSSSDSVNYVDPSTVVKGTMTDSRDGKVYKTVTIGTQTWMAENLNHRVTKSYCYESESSNCAKYGQLYTWAAAMDSAGTWTENGKGCGFNGFCSKTYPVRGVCPKGWHLPTDEEWETLFSAVGGSNTAGEMLKSTGGWVSDGNGTDDYSFAALPAGERDYDWNHKNEGRFAKFWSSNDEYRYTAGGMYLKYSVDSAHIAGAFNKKDAISVRCLKDEVDAVKSSSSVILPLSSSSLVDSSTVVKGTMTDERDGQTYKTVKIGSQIWMAENLNFAYIYTEVRFKIGSNFSDSSSWCYDNDPVNCAKYGRLYTWAGAIDSVNLANNDDKLFYCGYGRTCDLTGVVKGICPTGWHLPDTTEWKALFAEVGGQSSAGKILKSQTDWISSGGGTDDFGFAALPAGNRYDNGSFFYHDGEFAAFWSSTEYDRGHAYRMYLNYDADKAGVHDIGKYIGHSVRCVKDE